MDSPSRFYGPGRGRPTAGGLLAWAVPIESTQDTAPAGLITRGLFPWLRLTLGPVPQVVLVVGSDTVLRADELPNSSIMSSSYIDWTRTRIEVDPTSWTEMGQI